MRTGTRVLGGPAVALAVVGVLLAGCSSTVTGTAQAADGAGSASASSSSSADPSTSAGASSSDSAPTSSSSSSSSTPSFLAGVAPAPSRRPASLTLDGIDPCSLVSAALAKAVGVSATGQPGEAKCGFASTTSDTGGLLVRVVDRPASDFLGNPKVAGYPVAVGDYPAVVGWNLPDDGSSCYVNIDANDDANVEVSVVGPDGTGTAKLCPSTLTAASSVLERLLAG